MKTQRSIKLFSKIALLFLGAFALLSMFGVVAVPGIALAMAAGTTVAGGTLTQQEAVAKDVLDMPDVQRRVELYKQYQTPLLALISENKAPAVESWKYEFYAIENRGLYTTITSATAISSTNMTTLTVASTDMFTRFNVIAFTGITGETKISGGKFLVGLITGVGDNDTITVKLQNPGDALVAADLASEKIYRAGSAMNEKAASTTAWGKLPDKDYNYIQIFMEQVEESEYQQLMKKEADWGIKDLKKMAIEDFKMQRERTFLTGYRDKLSVTLDGTAHDIYTCGGILNDPDIPVLADQNLSTLASKTFVTWLKTFFTGNNGARKRFLLGGCDNIEAIEKVHVDNKYILAKETEVVNGIDFVKLVSAFGTLDVAYYEQLDLLGMQKDALVLDKTNIWTGDLKGKGFNIRPLDYKTSGIAAVDAAVIEQASTMLVKNKQTHHIIKGV